MSDTDLPDQIADAVVRRLAPSLGQQLARHQERMHRAWLTPPQAARLAGCREQRIYAALRNRSLPGCFNAAGNGGRGVWHILRSDFEGWVTGLHRRT